MCEISVGKILRQYIKTPEKYVTTGHERDTETGIDYRGAGFGVYPENSGIVMWRDFYRWILWRQSFRSGVLIIMCWGIR